MPRGGARNRSGPPLDENSGRSEARGVVFTALPSEGYDGGVPEFPLPAASERELEVWQRAWCTPQACVWALQPWRQYMVGQWVRWSVKAEADEVSAAVVAAAIRFADQIGLTPAGLKENGWKIATDELGEKRNSKTEDDGEAEDPRDRFRVVDGSAG